MTDTRRKLVVGNWKMHGSRVANAELLAALLAARPFGLDQGARSEDLHEPAIAGVEIGRPVDQARYRALEMNAQAEALRIETHRHVEVARADGHVVEAVSLGQAFQGASSLVVPRCPASNPVARRLNGSPAS